MTYKQQVLAALEAGPATTSDIALELFGNDGPRALHSAATYVWQLSQDGAPIREAARVDNTRGHKKRMKLWELQQ